MRREIRRPGRFLPRIPTKLILKFMCLAAAQLIPMCHFQPWGPKWKTQILSVSVGRKLKRHLFPPPLSLPRWRRRQGTALHTPGLQKTGSAVSISEPKIGGGGGGGGGEAPHLRRNQSRTAYQGSASLSDDGDMRANPHAAQRPPPRHFFERT